MNFDRALTPAEMDTIRDTIRGGGAEAGIVRFYAIAMGSMDAWVNATSVDPKAFAIPSGQWQQIGEWIAEWDRDHGNGVNSLLLWMNVGPSSRGEDPEPAAIRDADGNAIATIDTDGTVRP